MNRIKSDDIPSTLFKVIKKHNEGEEDTLGQDLTDLDSSKGSKNNHYFKVLKLGNSKKV